MKKKQHTHTQKTGSTASNRCQVTVGLSCVCIFRRFPSARMQTRKLKKNKTRTNVFYKEDARDWINDAHDWELATASSSQSTDFCRPAWFWSSHYHISLLCSGSVRRVLNSVGPVHLLSGVMCILNQLRFKWCEKQALPSARCKIAPLFAS